MWRVYGLRTAVDNLKLKCRKNKSRVGLGWKECRKQKKFLAIEVINLILLIFASIILMVLIALVMVRFIIRSVDDELIKNNNLEKEKIVKQIESVQVMKVINGAIITAYNSESEQTDSTPNITASNTQTRVGIIACPRRFDFGIKVEYAGQIYICEDRMNEKYDCSDGKCIEERWDIWIEDKTEALEFGIKKNQTIKIIL